MKKVMFAAAVAASLGLFADGIQSANTVGYQTYNFTAEGDYIHNIGVAFKNCTAVDGSYTITSNLFDTALQATLPQPAKIAHRVFGSWQKDEIRLV